MGSTIINVYHDPQIQPVDYGDDKDFVVAFIRTGYVSPLKIDSTNGVEQKTTSGNLQFNTDLGKIRYLDVSWNPTQSVNFRELLLQFDTGDPTSSPQKTIGFYSQVAAEQYRLGFVIENSEGLDVARFSVNLVNGADVQAVASISGITYK